jgi:hypothetical protein
VPERHGVGPYPVGGGVEDHPFDERVGLHGEPVAEAPQGVDHVLPHAPPPTVLCGLWNEEQAVPLGLDVCRVVGIGQQSGDAQRVEIDLVAGTRRR